MKKISLALASVMIIGLVFFYLSFCRDRNCFRLAKIWLDTGVYDHMYSCKDLPTTEEVNDIFVKRSIELQDKCDIAFYRDRIAIGDLKSACLVQSSSAYDITEDDYLQCKSRSDFVIRISVREDSFELVKELFGENIEGVPYRIIPIVLEGVPREGIEYNYMSEETFLELASLSDEMEGYMEIVDERTISFNRDEALKHGYSGLILQLTEETIHFQNELLNGNGNGEPGEKYPILQLYWDAATRYHKKNQQ